MTTKPGGNDVNEELPDEYEVIQRSLRNDPDKRGDKPASPQTQQTGTGEESDSSRQSKGPVPPEGPVKSATRK